MKSKKSFFLFGIGLLLLAAALCLTGYNLWDAARADREAAQVLAVLEKQIGRYDEMAAGQIDDGEPEAETREIPAVLIDQDLYIGILEIPSMDISLPVMGEWDYPKLRKAPCRYTGTVEQNNLIIAGHNYEHHFGGLKTLEAGAKVRFIDLGGAIYEYEVVKQEVLPKDAVEEMQEGDWDLTLFTCTVGGAKRVTVRCKKDA